MPSEKKRPVALMPADREALLKVTRTGVHPASMIRRAQVLLALDTSVGEVDHSEVIAARLGVSGETLRLVAKRFTETGGDVWATIGRKKRLTPPVEPKVTGEVEARVMAISCTSPPEGHDRWSLRLLEKHILLLDESAGIRRWITPRSAGSSKGGSQTPPEQLLDDPAETQR